MQRGALFVLNYAHGFDINIQNYKKCINITFTALSFVVYLYSMVSIYLLVWYYVHDRVDKTCTCDEVDMAYVMVCVLEYNMLVTNGTDVILLDILVGYFYDYVIRNTNINNYV